MLYESIFGTSILPFETRAQLDHHTFPRMQEAAHAILRRFAREMWDPRTDQHSIQDCAQDGSHGLCRGWTPFPEHYQHQVPVDPCSPCWGAKCWRKGVKERLVRAFPLSWFSTSLSFEVRACQASLSRHALRQAVRGHILEVGRGSSPTFEGCLRWVFAKVPQTQCRCQGYSGYGSTVVYRPTQLLFRIQMDSDQLL